MTTHYSRQGNCYLLSAESLSQLLTVSDFQPDALGLAGRIESQAEGRGSAWFIRLGDERAVLRHYYRGGLVAKLSKDSFFWTGAERSRAFAEFRLLEWMVLQGLPVPVPLGAKVQRSGLLYRCDLITRTLPHTQTLADRIAVDVLPAEVWAELGRVVRSMHALGVWHADLNAKNILIDDAGAVSLIDFDRCRRREGDAWQQDNLLRLRRSLDKLLGLEQIRHFKEGDWQSLLDGYQGK